MARVNMTDSWLQSLAVAKGYQDHYDTVQPGLRLRASTKSKKWSVSVGSKGTRRYVALGGFPEVGIDDARRKAAEIRADGAQASTTTAGNGARPRPRSLAPGMKEDIYSLVEGDVILQWPEQLSYESFEELEAWMKLMLRKLQRRITGPQDHGVSTHFDDLFILGQQQN